MEILVWFVVLLAATILVVVESVRLLPNTLSQAELERRANAGDKAAKRELQKRTLLPLYYGLQRLKVTVVVLLLIGLLTVIYPAWLALVFGLGLLLLVGVAVAQGWLGGIARWLQPKIEPHIFKLIKAGRPLFAIFAPRTNGVGVQSTFASKEELKQMIDQDMTVLDQDEKLRLVAALSLGNKAVADAMVSRDKIVTVGQNETVGPLLLDTLHKAGHNIVVVIGKDIDNVKGLLYMSDLVPLDPEIKTIKDAMRNKVLYLPASAPLVNVLGASLKTGRQLFLVADKGRVAGLITLDDALEHLLGSRAVKDVEVATKP